MNKSVTSLLVGVVLGYRGIGFIAHTLYLVTILGLIILLVLK